MNNKSYKLIIFDGKKTTEIFAKSSKELIGKIPAEKEPKKITLEKEDNNG